jgi:predicted membrane protein
MKMDEYDTYQKPKDAKKEAGGTRFNSTLLAVGIGMLLLGCLLFVDTLDHYQFGVNTMRLWPIIIIAIGVAKLVEQRCRRLSGWVIAVVGVLLLWHRVSGKPFHGLIGPCIIIAIGIFVVLHSRRRRRKHDLPIVSQTEGDFAQGTAILGGYNYKPNGGYFLGGDVTAIFGGFKLDLGRVTMKSDSVRLEVFALFGGGEIRVPEGWDVTVRAPAFCGAVQDNTRCPPPIEGRPQKLLIITGSIMFGGVTVKTTPYR